MKNLFRNALVCACLLLMLACTRGGGGSGGNGATNTKKLAFVTNNASDFWTYARKGTEKADAEFEKAFAAAGL